MKKLEKKKLYTFLTIIFLISITLFTVYKYFTSTKKVPNPQISDSSSNSSYYKSLYGTWVVTKHIPSNIKTKLNSSLISLCIGQKFAIDKDKITSSFATVSNPTINEGTITASDFSKRYNDTFKNIGIPGNEIKYINITESDENNHSVTIFISNDEKVYALLSGALFELKKQ